MHQQTSQPGYLTIFLSRILARWFFTPFSGLGVPLIMLLAPMSHSGDEDFEALDVAIKGVLEQIDDLPAVLDSLLDFLAPHVVQDRRGQCLVSPAFCHTCCSTCCVVCLRALRALIFFVRG